MGFNFRLQRVLKVREAKKKASAIELAGKLRTLEAEERMKQSLDEEFLQKSEDSERMAVLQVQGERREWLKEAILEQVEKVDQAREAVDQAAKQYSEDSQKTKVLENFREKQFEEFRLEEVRENRKELTEIALRGLKK